MNASDIAKTLKAKGQPMTLTRTGAGVFDPVTGGMTGGVVETFTVYGLTKNYRQADIANSNSLILGGDKLAIISADVAPVIADKLQIMGEDWIVISINELSPQGVALLYYCQLRK